ncbi:hypothetical protein JCM10213_002437 [Rhodosporidiobolus nylandii]
MTSILRLSSYSSSSAPPTTSHGHPRSPLAPAVAPPVEAFPPSLPSGAAKPSDVLINRAHEVKRIAKGLANWFQGLAQAHHQHSVTLAALSAPAKTPIPTPLAEAALFVPLSAASPDGTNALGGSAGGWQDILQEARETNTRVAELHRDLASRVTKEVVGPLMKLRVEMKTHITLMEREVSKLIDAVQRERDVTAPLLARLSTSLLPLTAPTPSEDPVLLRALIEAQLAKQVEKENELLQCVVGWTQKTGEREREVFEVVKRAWGVWEGVNSATHLHIQQLSMFLSASVDSLPSDAEWAHFLKLNHVPHPDAPPAPKTVGSVEYDGKGDARTGVVMEGLLERQSSFLRSWKPAYFLLTPSGHLHVYPPPPASSATPPSSAPTTPLAEIPFTAPSPAAPLTPSATHLLLHSTPLLSLPLSNCTLGPMPTPDKAADAKSGGGLEPVFTILEGEGGKTKHVVRVKGGKGEGDAWEEMGRWVGEIGKFCAAPPPPPSPVTSPRGSLLSAEPPALPSRSAPVGTSPSLPSLPTSPSSATSAPPPLPPRDDPPGEREEDLEVLNGGRVRSSLVISESGDLSGPLPYDEDEQSYRHSLLREAYDEPESPSVERRMLDGLGVAGAGLAASQARGETPPPVPPRDVESEDERDEPAESVEEEDENAGDLGAARRSSVQHGHGHASTRSFGSMSGASGKPSGPTRSGSVRSLAAAWEQNAKPAAGGSPSLTSPPVGSPHSLNSPVVEEAHELREEEWEHGEREREIRLDAAYDSPVLSQQQDEARDDSGFVRDGGDGGEEEDGEREETLSEPATPRSQGKKGKKKRKSKGGAGAKPTERPLPLPSIDPEHTDLGLPSPMSPAFDLSVPAGESPLRIEGFDPHDKQEEGEARSPMELEDVVEAPSEDTREEETREKEEK